MDGIDFAVAVSTFYPALQYTRMSPISKSRLYKGETVHDWCSLGIIMNASAFLDY